MSMLPQSEEVFLATTALEEFWDTTKPIVFLGEWCLLYERRSYWEKLNRRPLSSPYDNVDASERAYKYIDEIYERILPLLGEALNSIHKRKHGNRYWRILLGPWLRQYLSAVYDRFVHIEHALKQYPDCSSIGMHKAAYVVPADTLDFVCYLSEDHYNLQIYTNIFNALGKVVRYKEAKIPRNPLYERLLENSLGRRAIGFIANAVANLCARFFKTILLRNPYFPRKIELQLIARNLGRILPSLDKLNPCSRFEYDVRKRDALRTIEIGQSNFELCLSAMLFADMPQCFVEGFQAVENKASANYPKRVSAIFSANGLHYDEVFKQWAAMLAEKQVLLMGTQHGGNYGALQQMPSEDHETAIVDYYYSWGWERTNCQAKVVPMPATKLMDKAVIGAENSKKDILWVATSAPRYAVQLPFLPSAFQGYLAWQMRFATALPQELMADVRFRPHYQSHSWGIAERLKDWNADIRVESWSYPFQTSLYNCRLYVCDHLSTTFAEALASNKPTILFWNPATNKLRPEAQPYFDLLKNAGILFETPEAAASAVASVYKDVESWWNAPEPQRAAQNFCAKYARKSSNAMNIWSDEFKKITDLASRK